jgi:hypothetical protein
MALAMGTFIAPGMAQLSGDAHLEMNNILHYPDYLDVLTAIIILAVSQTSKLLYVIFISIKRPCTSFKNCKHCRESRQNALDQQGT